MSDTRIAETKHLQLIDRDGWSFVRRRSCTGVVCIVAITPQNELILVEQFRPPTDCYVIELPAGLAGDIADQSDESLTTAAKRELLEETGFEASKWEQWQTVTSSAGLTSETVTLFRAKELTKTGEGGGDESEQIEVHLVPLDDVDNFLDETYAQGKLVDPRVYTGLYFLRR